MKKYPVVMTIAGSDSSGGAGIQADLKTISALGAFGTTVITAITAQNTMGVSEIYKLPSGIIVQQFGAIISDMEVAAIKTGMLNSVETVYAVVECIDMSWIKNFILDPVMVATSGDSLITEDTISEMIFRLFPLAKLITPNLDEAKVILNKEISTLDEMKIAAKDLLDTKCKAVLLKGGHLDSGENVYDVYVSRKNTEPVILTSKRIKTKNMHGTGCTLSAAIATYLALGSSIEGAIVLAHEFVRNAIIAGKGYEAGRLNGPLNHAFDPKPMCDLPR